MLKRIATSALALTAAVLISGCASFATGQTLNGQTINAMGDDVAHVNGKNSGLYLLMIPLITGSTDSLGSISFGEDNVNVESVVDMVTRESAALGSTSTTDMTSARGGFWIPPIFFWETVQVSANAGK
jgi:hypothetical protein